MATRIKGPEFNPIEHYKLLDLENYLVLVNDGWRVCKNPFLVRCEVPDLGRCNNINTAFLFKIEGEQRMLRSVYDQRPAIVRALSPEEMTIAIDRPIVRFGMLYALMNCRGSSLE